MELTILMPCLNEAETLATCVRKARAFLDASGVRGEVLVADNGSSDGSQRIAMEEGARVVEVVRKGYGAALAGGIAAAQGRFVIMGDADDSYDFSKLMPFVEQLRQGSDLVMGNRFRGGIAPGAMPFLHRYLGNPVLSFLGRLFFRIEARDFHCGLRGFQRERILALGLATPGMEFASEMVVKASLAGYRIDEVRRCEPFDDDTIVLEYGKFDYARTIHMNLPEHPEEIEPSLTGHSIGRWEDDDTPDDDAAWLALARQDDARWWAREFGVEHDPTGLLPGFLLFAAGIALPLVSGLWRTHRQQQQQEQQQQQQQHSDDVP